MVKILLFGEPLIRFTPANFGSIGNKALTQMFYGGSEINIARNLQGFQVPSKLLTGLPANPVGASFEQFLKENGIDTSAICHVGNRIGTYYLENGFGCRPNEVYYDRQNTSISAINLAELDMNSLFKDVSHFHFSGITIAINEHVRNLLLSLLEEAKQRGITISIDLNLRAKMINTETAKQLFSTFASYADYCFGIDPIMANATDTNMFNREQASPADVKQRMVDLVETYHFKTIFHTYRTTDDYGLNHYQAYAYDGQFEQSIALKTAVLQRVGSGDAFVAGALYQLMNKAPLKTVVDFAVACGTLKCTVEGDSMVVSKNQVQQLLTSPHDIIR